MTKNDENDAAAEDCVIYEKRDRVAYITLNRPQVLNALDIRMHEELAAIWDDFEKDDNIWIGVLTGMGERSFSVGQDLKELVNRTKSGAPPTSFGSRGSPGYPRLTERFSVSKPLIARVNGYAFGGGFELALACDIIVAADHAKFSLPEAKLGLIAGAGGVFRLTRQLPLRTAMGLLMTGRQMDANQALRLGLINDAVPVNELDACVDGWIDDLLGCAPLSIRSIKDAVFRSLELTLPEAFQAHYPLEELRMLSEDCKEGPLAFIEKRLPRWRAM